MSERKVRLDEPVRIALKQADDTADSYFLATTISLFELREVMYESLGLEDQIHSERDDDVKRITMICVMLVRYGLVGGIQDRQGNPDMSSLDEDLLSIGVSLRSGLPLEKARLALIHRFDKSFSLGERSIAILLKSLEIIVTKYNYQPRKKRK